MLISITSCPWYSGTVELAQLSELHMHIEKPLDTFTSLPSLLQVDLLTIPCKVSSDMFKVLVSWNITAVAEEPLEDVILGQGF